MSRTSRTPTVTDDGRRPGRLPLDPPPKGVREVVLSRHVTFRYRRAGDYFEGSLYRLRRLGEPGEPILRFANRRRDLDELLRALADEADLDLDRPTIVDYCRMMDAYGW